MIDWTLTSEIVRNYAIAASAMIATVTFIFSEADRRRSVRIEKYREFVRLKNRFEGNQTFRRIAKGVDSDSSLLSAIEQQDKYRFYGFCEEVHLAIDNNILPENVAYHWFGYYALRASENEAFSGTMNLDASYWSLLRAFLDRMKRVEEKWRRTFSNSQKPQLKI